VGVDVLLDPVQSVEHHHAGDHGHLVRLVALRRVRRAAEDVEVDVLAGAVLGHRHLLGSGDARGWFAHGGHQESSRYVLSSTGSGSTGMGLTFMPPSSAL